MKNQKITINSKEVEIKALPFRKVLKLLKYLKTLPEKVKKGIANIDTGDVKSLDNTVAMGVLADILSESGDEIVDIIAEASGLSSKEVGGLGIADILRLFKALLEVNDIDEIKKELGELQEVFKK
jgi:hypothetical protein